MSRCEEVRNEAGEGQEQGKSPNTCPSAPSSGGMAPVRGKGACCHTACQKAKAQNGTGACVKAGEVCWQAVGEKERGKILQREEERQVEIYGIVYEGSERGRRARLAKKSQGSRGALPGRR